MERAVATPRSRRGRRRWLVAAAALAVLGGAGLLAWWSAAGSGVIVRPVGGPLPAGSLVVSAQKGMGWNSPGRPGFVPAAGATIRIEPATGAQRLLVDRLCMGARLSPDGRTLAYRTDSREVWIRRAGRAAPERVPGLDGVPVWSHDGKALLATSDATTPGPGPTETVRVEIDGFRRSRLDLRPMDHLDDVSGDGRWLLVTSWQTRSPDWGQTLLVSPDGRIRRRLTSAPLNLFPRFSPDGRLVAFTHFAGNERSVRIVGVDGSGPRTLIDFPLKPGERTSNVAACWAPDGSALAINEGAGVTIVGADGAEPRRLDLRVRRPLSLMERRPLVATEPYFIGAVEWGKFAD